MNFSFKKFLPFEMRETRWGELAEVIQSIYIDFKSDKINPIFNQYDIDEVSEDDIKELANLFGFNLKYLTGYTSTYNFLLKELLTIVPRIKTKTTPPSYVLNGIPFNLISNGYSVIYDEDISKYIGSESSVVPYVEGTLYLDRADKKYVYYISLVNCDEELVCDGSTILYSDTLERLSLDDTIDLTDTTLDATNFPSLDGSNYIYYLTRNFIFNYVHKFVENEDEFMSINTLKVLLNDIKQNKKLTDRCYFEPYLFIETTSDNLETDKIWTDYEGTALTTQKNILITGDLSDVVKIRFGNSSHAIIDGSITDVDNFTFEKDYDDDVSKITDESNHINFRLLITELQQFEAITEIALMDISDNCLLYSTFPKIQWDSLMYTNIKLDFEIT